MTSCEEIIRGPNTGLRMNCPGKLNASGYCSHEKYHLWSTRSGWCQCGACEGTKPEVDGIPQKTCAKWQYCPCECHDDISKLLAPRKQARVPYPDKWVRRIPMIVTWGQQYDQRQELLKYPALRVKRICEEWQAGDRSKNCTANFIVSQTMEEKPLSVHFVEELLQSWADQHKAFVGGEPMRFIKFMRG